MAKPQTKLRRTALVVAGVICALSPAISASPSQAVVIGFDDRGSGTVLDEQYAALGVHLGPSPFAGISGKLTAQARPAQARSGPNVAALAYDAGTDFSSSWIRFDKPQSRVTLHACRTGGGADPLQPNVNVDAYDSTGALIDNQQGIPCTLNGPLVPITVQRVGIAFINVGGFGGSAPPGQGWALDDLEFELDPPPPPKSPVTPPPSAPEEPAAESSCASAKPSLVGTAAADNLVGTPGRDNLRGRGGADCLAGRAGNDRLSGGSGRDRITGGSGSDRIGARDGSRDTIRCGSRRDRVVADRLDRVARDCEQVRRR